MTITKQYLNTEEMEHDKFGYSVPDAKYFVNEVATKKTEEYIGPAVERIEQHEVFSLNDQNY